MLLVYREKQLLKNRCYFIPYVLKISSFITVL